MIEFENEPIKTLRMYKSKQQTFLAVVDGERSIQNTQKKTDSPNVIVLFILFLPTLPSVSHPTYQTDFPTQLLPQSL